ncbi:MAG: hypothetical protein JO345_25930 [Streptosporangiaceae bacterium]|nr:hypothetical protein [Streptosporangiaceae bacterium]
MADTRLCGQCGSVFEPRREHSRFCSSVCRIKWVREHSAGPAAPADALAWSIAAMAEAADRLAQAAGQDLLRVGAVMSEAVWWVTIVDATMVRYEGDAYDSVLDGLPGEEARLIEETLAGLRYVRNQVGIHLDPAEFIRSAPDGTWTWNPLPEPCLESLSPRGKEWEMSRYRAYQSRLAGHDVAAAIALTSAFLTKTAWAEPPASPADVTILDNSL